MLCQPIANLVDFEAPRDFSLESTSLFGAMSAKQIETLWSLMQTHTCDHDDIIFQQGELPSNIYIIVSGEIEYSFKSGSEYPCLDVFKRGDVLGETAVIGIQAQAGTAKVSSKNGAKLLVLSRDALIDLQSRDINLFSLLMMNIARHVSRKYHEQLAPV